MPEVGINTKVDGGGSEYSASASKTATSSVTQQDGHISGTFTSTAATDKGTIIKTTPQYGDEYDLHMLAKNGSNPIGTFELYADPHWTIQGAVDAALSGDIINVKPGIYNENVVVYKSVSIDGAEAGNDPTKNTIVDGHQSGSVFAIGMDKQGNHVPGVTATLAGLTIQKETGTYSPTWLNPSDGGIYNDYSTLTVKNCIIIDNKVAGVGGGI